uniref:Somatostatin receptor type 2-like n=1 Tax=Saccoglossus kowalevskii TaxID=10224 RepID=A0ABM0M2A9_SACKO|nr:PREDICTED: somatostatin receptor type 2-like [Saccoglossus kowalevskii]
MVAIAIDRFCAIHFPMAFRVRFTLRRTRIIIVIVWLLACVAAMPTAFMFKAIYGSLGNNSVTYKGKSPFACKLVLPFGPWFSDFKAVYLNVILFYLPVLITAVLYSFIVYKVWRNGVAMATSRQTTKKSHSNAHWKTAKVLIAVFIAYTCCYVLLSTYNLVSRYFPQFYLHPMIKNVGLLLPYANSCINPIIYSFINKTFRQSVRTLICGHTDKGLRNTTSTYISSSNNHENVVSRMSQEGVTSPFEVDDNI